jgi:hypothetical protein
MFFISYKMWRKFNIFLKTSLKIQRKWKVIYSFSYFLMSHFSFFDIKEFPFISRGKKRQERWFTDALLLKEIFDFFHLLRKSKKLCGSLDNFLCLICTTLHYVHLTSLGCESWVKILFNFLIFFLDVFWMQEALKYLNLSSYVSTFENPQKKKNNNNNNFLKAKKIKNLPRNQLLLSTLLLLCFLHQHFFCSFDNFYFIILMTIFFFVFWFFYSFYYGR